MMEKLKISKRILLYIAFAFFMLGFFLYLRFPGRMVENYIVAGVAERYPDALMSLQSLSLTFPPGLGAENITFGFRADPEATFKADRFRVRPRFLGYVSGKSSFLLDVRAYGGAVRGRIDFPLFLAGRNPEKAEIAFKNLTIEKCAYLREKTGGRLTGNLEGVLTYDGDLKLTFNVKKGSYQLLENAFGFDRLDFNTAEGEAVVRKGVLKLNKLALKGDKINYSLKGDIMLASEFRNSVINLSGVMEIPSLDNKKVQTLITGTIGNASTRYQ